MSHPLYAAPKKSNCPDEVPHTAYQVDYVAVNCGRIVPASKRRIRFKFGFTNVEALSAGLTGQDCRGSEHEVIITWSLSSGKQAIAFDGQEVFFDIGDTTQSKLQYSWPDKSGRTLMVKVHAAPLSTKVNPDPDWRQYDLFIDGISYFHLRKIFQLCVFPKNTPDEALKFAQKLPPRALSNEPNHFTFECNRDVEYPPPQDDDALPTKLEKLEPEPVVVADLLSFDDSPAVDIAPSPVQLLTQTDYSSAQLVNFSSHASATNSFNAPTTAYAGTQHSLQAYAHNAYHTVTPTSSPGTSDIMNSNNQTSQAPSAMYSNYQINTDSPAVYGHNPFISDACVNYRLNVAPTTAYAPESNAPAPVTPLNSSFALVTFEPTRNTYDGAVKNLVNIDDLFGNSAAPITKASLNENMNQANAHKSLGELKGSSNTNAPKKPVMNTFNPAPAYQQQGMYPSHAPQQQQQQQYNTYHYNQQGYAQPGFQYQQPTC